MSNEPQSSEARPSEVTASESAPLEVTYRDEPAKQSDQAAQADFETRHARQLEELARRDRELLTERHQRKQEQEELQRLRALRDADPDDILRAFGKDPLQARYDALTRPEPEDPTQQRLQSVESELSAMKAARQQAEQSARYSGALSSIRAEIERSRDAHPFVSRMLGQPGGDALLDGVLREAALEWRQTGQMVPYGDLIARREKELRGVVAANLKALSDVGDFKQMLQELLGPGAASQPPAPSTQRLAVSGRSGGEPSVTERPMSEEDLQKEFLKNLKDIWTD